MTCFISFLFVPDAGWRCNDLRHRAADGHFQTRLPYDRRKQSVFMPSLSAIPGEIVAFTARCLLRLFFRARCIGTLPKADKMLIISNHQSFVDGVLIGAFLPISPTYLIHSTIANRWYFKFPLLFLRHKVVDTNNPLAIKALVSLVEEGHPVVIFPEGRITQTGSLMKIYDGPAFVAAKTGCTVVPLHIDGAVYSPFSRMKGDFPQKTFPTDHADDSAAEDDSDAGSSYRETAAAACE